MACTPAVPVQCAGLRFPLATAESLQLQRTVHLRGSAPVSLLRPSRLALLVGSLHSFLASFVRYFIDSSPRLRCVRPAVVFSVANNGVECLYRLLVVPSI